VGYEAGRDFGVLPGESGGQYTCGELGRKGDFL
jgi:hypothetical protein